MTGPAAIHLFADASPAWELFRGRLAPLALAVGGVILITIFTRSRMRKRSLSNEPGVRDRYRQAQQQGRGERELGDLMIELDQLAREIHGRLDTQFAKLEAVIRDADRRIDHLNRLLRASRNEPTLDVTVVDENEVETPLLPREPESGLHADVYGLVDAGRSLLEVCEQTGRPKGEIELILALRRVRQRSAAASVAGTNP